MTDKSKDLGSLSISDEFDRFAKLDDNLDGGFAVQLDALQMGTTSNHTNTTTTTSVADRSPAERSDVVFNPAYRVTNTNINSDGVAVKVVHHIAGFSRPG